MNVSELKPCPFCGGAPRKERSSGDERDGYADRVSYVCMSCGCHRGASGDSSKGGYADNSKVEEAALAKWNTRMSATTCPGHGRSECVSCCWPKGDAPVVPVQTCQIGIYGKAYDGPEVTRAYTYHHQPDNAGASKLGRACYTAIKKPGGDSIDLGLYLLKLLEEEGFGVFEVKS